MIKGIKNLNNLWIDTHIGWKIPYNCKLNFTFMEVSYNWACEMDERELFGNLNIHMGTFVSNMQRIINILDELQKICDMIQYNELEKLCIDAKKKIHRGIVNFDSLYLS